MAKAVVGGFFNHHAVPTNGRRGNGNIERSLGTYTRHQHATAC
jgi:hypothetical protein